MHEESGDHYEYRQHAKANHCNSNPNVRQKPLPLHQKSGGSANISQSPMVAEGNAVMVKFNLCRAADTISRSRDAAMYLCQFKASGHHQMEYTTPASITALRMIVVTPATSRMQSWRGSNAMLVLLVPAQRQALIWIMQGSPLGDLTDEIELLTFALGG